MGLRDFNSLLAEGGRVLADVSDFGMRVDEGYLADQLRRATRKQRSLREAVLDSDGGREWQRRYGDKLNLESPVQLSAVLFDCLGVEAKSKTDKGNPSVDAAALKELEPEVPFLGQLLALRKNIKTTQYLEQIRREVVGGFIHPAFHLHRARTFRSSSSNPNFQNLPIRDKEQGRTIRRCFIPREGRQILEVDYSGIEVRVAACYHKDPTMLEYINDPAKDMHRDMSAECYLLPVEEVTKDIRYCGKNCFVFPQFYGSWWKECSRSLWDAIPRMNLVTESGMPLREWLAGKHIRSLALFEKHIERVERNFWERRFPVYDKWKREWHKGYLRRGYIDGLTGFRCSTLMSRNDCINYPVQGAAFHCLLWSLVRAHGRLLEHGFGRCIVGQIHDSMVLDIEPEYLAGVVELLSKVMTKEIRKHWPWLIVPLDIEAEASPPDEPWHAKEKYIQEESAE